MLLRMSLRLTPMCWSILCVWKKRRHLCLSRSNEKGESYEFVRNCGTRWAHTASKVLMNLQMEKQSDNFCRWHRLGWYKN